VELSRKIDHFKLVNIKHNSLKVVIMPLSHSQEELKVQFEASQFEANIQTSRRFFAFHKITTKL